MKKLAPSWVIKWLSQFFIALLVVGCIFRKMKLVFVWGILCWWLPCGYFLLRGRKIDAKLDYKKLMVYFVKQEVLKWMFSILLIGIGGFVFGWCSGSWMISYIVAVIVSLLFAIKKYD